MNDLDSELIEGIMLQQGYIPGSLEESDIAILVTCCVRETAENRALGRAARLKKWKEAKPGRCIVFAGCLAQKEARDILKKIPHIDYVVGPGNIFELAELLAQGSPGQTRVNKVESRDLAPIVSYRRNSFRASVNITYGCDNYCAYCIVPFVRGKLVHRPVDDILQEVQSLVDNGIKEITLLGQNVNAYSFKGYSFSRLLRTVANIDGLKRVRFVTSHPKDFTYDIIRVIAEEPAVCESLHLPLQSGSDKILARMGRKYTLEEYLDIVRILRREIPDIALSGDFITGFPGETEKDFLCTVNALENIRYDTAFLFLYNNRPRTKAASMQGHLPYHIRQQRLEKLIEVQQNISREINQKYIGKTFSVLVTHPSPRYNSQIVGRSRSDKNVVFEGDKDLIGSFVRVKIREAYSSTLIGVMCAHEKALPS